MWYGERLSFDYPLMVYNDAVVAHAFEGDEVALGDIGGIEADGSSALSIGLDLWVPVEGGALVGARLL